MNKEIQEAFIDGLNEVYSEMFTDGVNDGIKLYLLDTSSEGGFYGESKVKRYKNPVLLVSKIESSMVMRGEVVVESEFKDNPKFTVPYKALRDKNILCQKEEDWEYLRRGYIEFHGAFYEIKNVSPKNYIEDTFMALTFECEYRQDIKSLLVITDNK